MVVAHFTDFSESTASWFWQLIDELISQFIHMGIIAVMIEKGCYSVVWTCVINVICIAKYCTLVLIWMKTVKHFGTIEYFVYMLIKRKHFCQFSILSNYGEFFRFLYQGGWVVQGWTYSTAWWPGASKTASWASGFGSSFLLNDINICIEKCEIMQVWQAKCCALELLLFEHNEFWNTWFIYQHIYLVKSTQFPWGDVLILSI